MRCPFCGADDTQVIDSRVNEEGNSIRRRRRCADCDKRFTTYETAELHLPQVVKQNGSREEFSRDKLRLSFTRALHKRPVPTEYVDRAIEHIVQKILGQGEREIMARSLGEIVMQELRLMDKVAYIRFASVYRSFQDVDDFHDVIRDLDKRDLDKFEQEKHEHDKPEQDKLKHDKPEQGKLEDAPRRRSSDKPRGD